MATARPSEGTPPVPPGWHWITLQECTDILDGRRRPINSAERERRIAGKAPSELFPYYGATGHVGWIDDFIFDEELVLLGEDGAPFLEAAKPKAYIVRGKCWVNNHAHVLRARHGVTTNQFLMHYLNHFDFHDYVTGTTRLKLNQGRMRAFPFLLPPLPEQERIVNRIEELLSELDAGVAALERVRAGLKRYKASVLRAAVTGRLFDSHEDLARDELPRRWRWGSIGEATASMKNGIYRPADYYADDGVACLRMYNIEDGEIVWKDIKRMRLAQDEIEIYRVMPGDILVNRVNSRELVGKAAVIPRGIETTVFESKNIRLRIRPEIADSRYISLCIGTYRERYFNLNAQQVVGMASISQPQIAQMPIPLPPPDDQKQIADEVERRMSVVAQLASLVSTGLLRAARLRQAVLKAAFEGRL